MHLAHSKSKNKRYKSSLKSHVPELRHNSEHVDAVISGMGRPQENRIFRFLNIHYIIFRRCSLHEM